MTETIEKCPFSDLNSCEQYRSMGQRCQDCPMLDPRVAARIRVLEEDRQQFEQRLWRAIDDGALPEVPSDLVDAVERIKAHNKRLTKNLDEAKALIERLEVQSPYGLGSKIKKDLEDFRASLKEQA